MRLSAYLSHSFYLPSLGSVTDFRPNVSSVVSPSLFRGWRFRIEGSCQSSCAHYFWTSCIAVFCTGTRVNVVLDHADRPNGQPTTRHSLNFARFGQRRLEMPKPHKTGQVSSVSGLKRLDGTLQSRAAPFISSSSYRHAAVV